MPTSMLLVGLGALLVLCGVVLVAVRVMKAGPLSRERRSRGAVEDTLEPRESRGLFDFREHLPGVVLIVLGIILLIASAGA